MIIIRWGDIEGQEPDGKRGMATAERPNEVVFPWPQWDIEDGPSLSYAQRTHTTPTDDGAYTQILETDPVAMSLTIVHMPYLEPTPLHWLEVPLALAALRNRWVDVFVGPDEWGEWVLHAFRMAPDQLGIVPAVVSQTSPEPQGIYSKRTELQLSFLSDRPIIAPLEGPSGTLGTVIDE